ncbi:enoyl-CoA hydratase/isomerase family protein [Bradyrhizobium manausense]|uniref:enoyl-CoA hydratase/isomerase family protein n=1 Tax=Bradyrhizobium TaxID=374 RepID=UPI001BA4D421|nr:MULTISPECIES: enoyl-CoA hydratase-related protein [Bradyrhizobium]MBR0827266.1 enoyl-CoA hydratase/isomerase family protein [Bradyrhizobium manausense]UVO27234.1 enoyl-CoA hydratase/isomerase family protein [Bradyrhizobium arachidis]
MSAEKTTDIVSYELVGNVARITLARPPVNALSLEVIRSVVAGFRRAAADPGARVVVLASALAKRFSAGLDLDILMGKSGAHVREFLQALYIDLFDAQYHLGKPSIAAVGGAARGGGMTMAVSCDVVLASDSATFGYPEIEVGVIPSIHYAHLPRIVGRHRAFELLFTGRAFSAAEACEIGIVNRVVPDAELEAEVVGLAAQFAAKSETVVRMGRAAFMRQIDLDYRRSIASAVEDFCNVAATDEAQEGLRAFVEKRPPKW